VMGLQGPIRSQEKTTLVEQASAKALGIPVAAASLSRHRRLETRYGNFLGTATFDAYDIARVRCPSYEPNFFFLTGLERMLQAARGRESTTSSTSLTVLNTADFATNGGDYDLDMSRR
jgi:hypothetical protein